MKKDIALGLDIDEEDLYSTEIINASRIFLRECKFAMFVQNLKTKIRVVLKGDYFLDMYYNKTLGKYAYTLVKENRRIIGWDNAPHHKGFDNFPHHFHTAPYSPYQ